jgi:hypothetical protein
MSGPSDSANVYDKPLFSQTKSNYTYRGGSNDDAASQRHNTTSLVDGNTARFKADRGFAGADGGAVGGGGSRDGPVQFEKETADDPFGMKKTMADATARTRDRDRDGDNDRDDSRSSRRKRSRSRSRSADRERARDRDRRRDRDDERRHKRRRSRSRSPDRRR